MTDQKKLTFSEKIAKWPSTHANLITAWVAMIVSIGLSWYIILRNMVINETIYYFTMGAVFAWAGITAPATLLGKRATTKTELMQKVTENEDETITQTRVSPLLDADESGDRPSRRKSK